MGKGDEERLERLRDGLKESLKLQSHYARLLNQYDGGERKGFGTIKEWLDRIDEVKENVKKSPFTGESKK